jgi:RNA polymerase primary sigma factor
LEKKKKSGTMTPYHVFSHGLDLVFILLNQELIADDSLEDPETRIARQLLKADVNKVLKTLNDREIGVVKLRYGLEDGRMRTLEEIGRVFGVTRERVRQIESKAMRKLKQPERNAVLKGYTDTDY